MTHLDSRGKEEVPCCFSKSCVKFQHHTSQKVHDLDPIWAKLLGRSHLTNPSDLLFLLF